ncbi:hypothetical protein D3C87_86110 [compost metagenome]
MKTILEVKQFLEGFVADEYKVNISKLDRSVADEEHDELVEDFFTKYYSLFYGSLDIGSMIVRLLDDLDETIIEANLEVLQKREIYLIKQYKNTKFGKGILRDGEDMFSCFLGPIENYQDDHVYTDNFIVAVYKNELKIVSKRTLDHEYKGDKLNWGYDKRSVEKADGMTVLNIGELVDVLRLREPDDEFWMKDYNEEN